MLGTAAFRFQSDIDVELNIGISLNLDPSRTLI